MHGRTLAQAMAIVVAALVVPSLALEPLPAFWSWLASFRPGSPQAAEGVLRATPRADGDVVVLGSSVAVYDIYDEALTEELDRPVINAGIMAASVCATAMLIDEVEARRPGTVLYVMGARDLSVCHVRRGRGPIDLDVALHAVGPVELVRDEDWLAAALGEASILIRHRAVPHMFRSASNTPGWRFHPRFAERFAPGDLEPRVDRVVGRLRAVSYDGDGGSTRALERFAARARAVGTDLVLAPAPTHPRVVERATGVRGTSWHPGQIRMIRRMAERVGARFVSPEELGEFEETEFLDPSHLFVRGQVRYTRAVARAMR